MLVTVGLTVGGTEGQLLEIASRLDRARFEVTVCALKESGPIASELRRRGIRVHALRGRGWWDVRVLYRLFRLIRAENPHIIHAFLFWAHMAALVVGRLLHVPVLVSSYRDAPLWTGSVRRMADRVTARWAQAVTCCSDAVRELAVTQLGGDPARYRTIHNGVDAGQFTSCESPARAELGLREKLPVVGTVCRLDEPKKGLSTLLEAMADMSASTGSDSCQLLIVGDGPARSGLHALSRKLGIAPWVRFAGERHDVARVLSLMDVFVLPSRHEGFGIAILEAMAAGLPVVATNVGGIPEIVVDGETGLLVPPGDAPALANAIRYLLTHPAQAEAFGARGRRRARETFSIDAVVKEHERLYLGLAAAYLPRLSAESAVGRG